MIGGEDKYRHVFAHRVGPQYADDLSTRHTWHHHIYQNQRRPPSLRLFYALGAVISRDDLEACFGQ